jgi:hypothetical protein
MECFGDFRQFQMINEENIPILIPEIERRLLNPEPNALLTH